MYAREALLFQHWQYLASIFLANDYENVSFLASKPFNV